MTFTEKFAFQNLFQFSFIIDRPTINHAQETKVFGEPDALEAARSNLVNSIQNGIVIEESGECMRPSKLVRSLLRAKLMDI